VHHSFVAEVAVSLNQGFPRARFSRACGTQDENRVTNAEQLVELHHLSNKVNERRATCEIESFQTKDNDKKNPCPYAVLPIRPTRQKHAMRRSPALKKDQCTTFRIKLSSGCSPSCTADVLIISSNALSTLRGSCTSGNKSLTNPRNTSESSATIFGLLKSRSALNERVSSRRTFTVKTVFMKFFFLKSGFFFFLFFPYL
jgi:hypothetical protein